LLRVTPLVLLGCVVVIVLLLFALLLIRALLRLLFAVAFLLIRALFLVRTLLRLLFAFTLLLFSTCRGLVCLFRYRLVLNTYSQN
jgi:hypothetical protein